MPCPPKIGFHNILCVWLITPSGSSPVFPTFITHKLLLRWCPVLVLQTVLASPMLECSLIHCLVYIWWSVLCYYYPTTRTQLPHTVAIKSICHPVWPVTCLINLWFRQFTIIGNFSFFGPIFEIFGDFWCDHCDFSSNWGGLWPVTDKLI